MYTKVRINTEMEEAEKSTSYGLVLFELKRKLIAGGGRFFEFDSIE